MSKPTFDPIQQRKKDLLTRLMHAQEAEEDLLRYTCFTMPDAKDPSPNPRTRYLIGRQHEAIAAALHRIEQGRSKRVIINCGPRHGKTELASKRFISWYSGRHPEESLIFGTYNENFAADAGRAVREITQSPEHQIVFPEYSLKDGSSASQRLETMAGGILAFVGRGGTITGRGGHGIVIDDPIKDRKEADSKTIRDQLWTWFTQVIGTRRMTEDAWVMVIQTRWHEDDLVGRLTDPTNPYYDPDEAAQWDVIDLPALALEDDVLGRKPGEALWPERFSRKFLLEQQRLDPRGFQALYQGRPSSGEGAFFHAHHLHEYTPDQLPQNLRYYVASDHAVSTEQARDKTAIIPVGVDDEDNIYVLPDVFWRRAASDQAVEAMLAIMRQRKPLFWWAERGQITKSIGPFLRKRMREERTYTSIIEITPVRDKQSRAQSIQARMSMGKVFFPKSARWWPEARDQLLKFPHGTHDDFVDALAYIGLGLDQQVSANAIRRAQDTARPGSFNQMFASIRADQRTERLARAKRGW
nr:phage terminase large subunit [uncultured Cohaesibacter sp.]